MIGEALVILGAYNLLFGENKGGAKKKKSRRKSGTWYDSLNEGDKAWLYSHHS